MAVSRAEKEQELQDLTAAFKAASTAIVVDYRGLNVPAVTELRNQLRGAKAKYRVVKNTLAKQASAVNRMIRWMREVVPAMGRRAARSGANRWRGRAGSRSRSDRKSTRLNSSH